MPFHFSLQSRPDTFGNTMYDILKSATALIR